MEINTQALPRPLTSADAGSPAAVPRRSEPVAERVAPPAAAPPDLGPGEQAVAQINEMLRAQQQSLQFSLDEESHRMIYRVIDTVSGEVIRQIPSEALIDLARNLARAGSGLLNTQA